MPPQKLEFPLGIRLWDKTSGERRATLQQGYTFSSLEHSSDSFRFTALAGADKIPDLFSEFARSLPEEAFFILEFYEEDVDPGAASQPQPTVYYSPYLPVPEVLELVADFLPRLIHDGFVGFGLANNREGVELFYSEEKVLTCFTGNHLRVFELFSRHGLAHEPDLVFPTDVGHDHYSLLCHERESLPVPFARMSDRELDYVHFCGELIERLDMYPVEETLSFFLSKREQDSIESLLVNHPDFCEFADEDFGSLLLDWNDFVTECEAGFQGDLYDYRLGLQLRDVLQFVIEGVPAPLAAKLRDIIGDADGHFRRLLVDRRKRLDPPNDLSERDEHFWYQGMVGKQGVHLRRDLIRHGWYRP